MTQRDLAEMSKEELIRELEKLETAERRLAANAGEADRERLIHDLHVQQVQLEMQNRELREAQERLEEVTSRYSDLYDFAPVGYCTLDPEGRIRELNLTAAALFGAFRETLVCMIDVAAESGAVEREVVLFADPKKQATLAERLMQFTPRPGWQSPQARVIASSEPMLLTEVSTEQRERLSYDNRHADALRAADIRSLMVVPLNARGWTLGALTLASAESDRRYSSFDLQVAQDLASRIAMALDNARLYDDAQRANQALRLAEAKSSGIVSISADAIISIDENQRITLFNDGAEKIFGYSKAEAIGAPLDMLIPERFRAIHHQHVEKFATAHEVARKMGERGAAISGRRRDGEEFPADAAISTLEVEGARILTVALRDVTEQRRVEWEQTFFAEVGKELASSLEYEDMLTRVAQLVVRELADFSVLHIVEEDGEVRRTVHRTGPRPGRQGRLRVRGGPAAARVVDVSRASARPGAGPRRGLRGSRPTSSGNGEYRRQRREVHQARRPCYRRGGAERRRGSVLGLGHRRRDRSRGRPAPVRPILAGTEGRQAGRWTRLAHRQGDRRGPWGSHLGREPGWGGKHVLFHAAARPPRSPNWLVLTA
jgi:PAS domain S-box-containing protein